MQPEPTRTNPTARAPQDKLPSCPHINDNSYAVSSSGFRLVHGDVCTGIDKIIADTDGKGNARGGQPPPGRRKHGGGGSGLFAVVMVLVAVGGAGGGWLYFIASPAQKAAAMEVGGAAGAFCAGLWALAADWFDSLLARLGAGVGGLRGGGAGYTPLDEEVGGVGVVRGPEGRGFEWGMLRV